MSREWRRTHPGYNVIKHDEFRERNPEKVRAWQRKNAPERAKRHKDLVQGMLAEHKLLLGCVDCGFREFSEALEFDHISGQKKFSLAKAFEHPMEEVIEELSKCEVVCANCHRARTARRRQP